MPDAADLPELQRRAAEGDVDAREQVVLAHLGLVVRIACKYAGYGLPIADLISEGNIGLLRAAELFRPKFGVEFSVYASVWMKQRMHRAITAQARVVRIPVWRSQRLRKLDRLHEELHHELGRDPELTELADRLGIAAEDLERMAGDKVLIDGLDDHASVLNDGGEPVIEKLSREELLDEITACLDGLDDTELQILGLKFGLLEEEPASYREMAPRFGKSREWIRRIGEGALAKVKMSLEKIGSLPRTLVMVRREKAAARLRKLSGRPVKLSLWNMALIQWLEPLIAIL